MASLIKLNINTPMQHWVLFVKLQTPCIMIIDLNNSYEANLRVCTEARESRWLLYYNPLSFSDHIVFANSWSFHVSWELGAGFQLGE